jgi:uncharacterized protein (TIGR02594 family)
MNDPRWLDYARTFIGLREIPGVKTAGVIEGWLVKLGAWWRDDETPWCGTFVAAMFQQTGINLPQHWYRARGWLDWGTPLVSPAVGCVAVLERDGGGHVGFVVGQDEHGNILMLGGNQGNAVSIAAFPRSRVIGYRWPAAEPFPVGLLPQMAGAPASTGEA